MTPRLEAKIAKSNGQIKLLNINIDKFGEIVNVFQVKAVPTIFLVYKGKGLDSFTGDISDDMLNKFFETITRATKFDQGESDVAKKI
jgi:thioredoxin-like negative regulator of GroEL